MENQRRLMDIYDRVNKKPQNTAIWKQTSSYLRPSKWTSRQIFKNRTVYPFKIKQTLP